MAGILSRTVQRLGYFTKADIDEWWTGYSFAIIPIGGSWFTGLAAGAAIWAGVSLVFGRFKLDLPKQSLPLVIASTALAIWAMFVGIYHDGLDGLYKGMLFAAPLL